MGKVILAHAPKILTTFYDFDAKIKIEGLWRGVIYCHWGGCSLLGVLKNKIDKKTPLGFV